MQVKLSIVDEDPQERGRRAALNLGHTFAHALEIASRHHLHHGEAVAVGLVGAARLAHSMGLCQPDLPDRVQHVLQRFSLPISCPGLDREQILAAMTRDKKGRDGRVRFVLPVRPGQIQVGMEAPEAQVRQIVDEMRGGV
jgi:3-dehydroquinate synthetase